LIGRKFVCGAVFAALLTTGCSHAGDGGLSQATSLPGATGTRNAQDVVATSGSNSTVTGTIYAGTASEMNVNAGSGCGYVNVYTNSSTSWTYNGYSVANGTPITFTGTGSCGTSFTASQVTLGGTSAAPNLTGTIYGVSGDTVNVNGGSTCGYVNVTYNSSTSVTYNGYSMVQGTAISVWGAGTCGTSFVATKITLGTTTNSSASISQKHVLTGDYLGGANGTSSVAWSTAASVLSWAEVSSSEATAISATGIKTLDYIAPFFQTTTDPLYTATGATFSVNCAGDRISIPYTGTSGLWLMNPTSTVLEGLMNTWQAGQQATGHIDAFFYDDIDTLYGVPMPCNTTQSSWDGEGSSFISTSTNPVVFNGYSSNTDTQSLIQTSKIEGGMTENCYATTGNAPAPYITGSQWVINANLQLLAAAHNKLFFCYNNGSEDGADYIQLRNYIFASFLISYTASSSILWETFTTPSELHVFPETEVVPTDPLVSTPTSVTSLLKSGSSSSGGVFVREYSACYINGSSVGHCAAIVNTSSTTSYALPSLSQSYGHTMAISGNGSLDGGSVSATGSAPPSTVAPETGFIAFP
jgi:hypothetical protein